MQVYKEAAGKKFVLVQPKVQCKKERALQKNKIGLQRVSVCVCGCPRDFLILRKHTHTHRGNIFCQQ